MEKTPFAGLTRLFPEDSLSEDDFSFQSVNPVILDALLRLAVRDHRHDAHAALADPTLDPTLAVVTTGGTIPAETAIYVGYTLIDSVDGETKLNTNVGLITTQDGLTIPDDSPTLAVDLTAGNLLAGSYDYAVTVKDGGGGETELGPVETIIIDPGSPTARIMVSGLATIISDSGGTAARLWRRVNGGDWSLINDSASDTVTDDGTLCPNSNVQPPDTGSGTTNATNALHVTVPTGQPAGTISFRIYASTDGLFGNPALLGTYPIADAGSMKTYTALTFLDGEPPEVSRTYPGANQIDPDTELLDWHWKRAVADHTALNALTGNDDGDVRITLSDHRINVYGGGAWHDLLDFELTVYDETTPLTHRAKIKFQGGGVVASDDGTDSTLVTVPALVVYDEASALTQRFKLKFTGAAVLADDDTVDTTVVHIPATIIYDETTGLPWRNKIKFQGAGVVATDDGTDSTIVTIAGGGGGGSTPTEAYEAQRDAGATNTDIALGTVALVELHNVGTFTVDGGDNIVIPADGTYVIQARINALPHATPSSDWGLYVALVKNAATTAEILDDKPSTDITRPLTDLSPIYHSLMAAARFVTGDTVALQADMQEVPGFVDIHMDFVDTNQITLKIYRVQ